MVAVLQFRRVFLASSLVGAGWCLPRSAFAFGCVSLRVFCSLVYPVLFFLSVWWRSCAALVRVFLPPACCVFVLLLSSWGSPSSGTASSIAPDLSRVLGTGLEVFPTPASARCSSYCLNSCKERRAAGSSGWVLSGTIPTQAQSAPSSGAAFFTAAQPATCF